jgi:hypothetical protein
MEQEKKEAAERLAAKRQLEKLNPGARELK